MRWCALDGPCECHGIESLKRAKQWADELTASAESTCGGIRCCSSRAALAGASASRKSCATEQGRQEAAVERQCRDANGKQDNPLF